MTKTKRALTATTVVAAATATALVPATAQAQHFQPRQDEVTSVVGHADFRNLPTHDRVLIGARGTADDGFGVFRVQNDDGTLTGRITCVTGSRATRGFTDAAIGVHITRSTIPGLPRGTDAVEYVRDGGWRRADASGLVAGTADCPESGFTVPAGVLVRVPSARSDNYRFGNRWNRYSRYNRAEDCDNRGHGRWHGWNRYLRGEVCRTDGNDRFATGDGYRVQIQA
jgi:hypothetical protein